MKIQAIGEWHAPKTIGGDRLATFYRMFIHDFSMIAALIMECLKKRKFNWKKEEEGALLYLRRSCVLLLYWPCQISTSCFRSNLMLLARELELFFPKKNDQMST